MQLFELFGSIFIDSKEAEKNIENTEKKAEGFGNKLTSGIKTAAKWGAAVGAGAMVATTAMIGFATKAGNAADRLLDLSDITGMSTDELQRWEKVTKVAGVSLDAINGASKKLTKSMDTLSTGTGKGSEALERLGVSYDDISKMSADERINILTAKLGEIEDTTERARIGTDLFGGSWADIAPIVGMGADEMERIKASANIFSEEDLKKANDFRISMDLMKDKVGFLAMELGIKLLPIAQRLFDWIDNHMPQIETAFTVAFNVIEGVVSTVGNVIDTYLMPILQVIFDWVAENMPQIQSTFETVWGAIQVATEVFVNLITGLWNLFGDNIKTIVTVTFNVITNLISNAFKIIEGLFKIFKGLFTADWQTLKDGIIILWNALWNTIKTIVGGAWGLLKEVFDSLVKSITGVFTGLAKLAFDWGKNMINGFIDGIKAMASKVTDAAKGVMNNVKGFLGFNSPAEEGEGRFIEDWGFNMIDGFLDGVKGAIPLIKDTLNMAIPDPTNNFTSKILPIEQQTSQKGTQTANIIIELDGSTIAKVIGEPLVEQIRLKTGLAL